MEKVKQCR